MADLVNKCTDLFEQERKIPVEAILKLKNQVVRQGLFEEYVGQLDATLQQAGVVSGSEIHAACQQLLAACLCDGLPPISY
jgi:hypothetical protein